MSKKQDEMSELCDRLENANIPLCEKIDHILFRTPYAAGLGELTHKEDEIGVLRALCKLTVRLSRHAEECQARENELDSLKSDIRAMRRILGTKLSDK